MKAMILCAGLGTRLKPWTETHPKALFPIDGKPMLEIVLGKLTHRGFNRFVVNAHHFADQIEAFVGSNADRFNIEISDETAELLDTGGAILNALPLLADEESVLIHNVDILTDTDYSAVMACHMSNGADATLVCSHRNSTRKLLKRKDTDEIIGWRNLKDDSYRWKDIAYPPEEYDEIAFNGIYVINTSIISSLERFGKKFSIMDYILCRDSRISVFIDDSHQFLDIGKPGVLDSGSSISLL